MKKQKLEVNKIINGHNIEVLKTFPDECIDLTVTSPPYDDLRDYKGYTFNFEELAHELYRVTKKGGVIVWVVGDQVIERSESGSSFKQALYFKEECGFLLYDTMIYSKKGFSNPSTSRYHQTFEYMFVLSKGKPKTFNPIIDRVVKNAGRLTSTTKRQVTGETIRVEREIICGNEKGLGKRYNIWEYDTGFSLSASDKIAFEHPAIFPEPLAEDHIISWSNKGDVVLDPMNGSGTTTKMAYLNGRKYVGIDVSKRYCEIARKRIKDTTPKVYRETNKKQILKRHINLLEC